VLPGIRLWQPRSSPSIKVHSCAEFHETIYNCPVIYRLFPMNFLFVKLSQNYIGS
jgi:hypothetical protein